MPQHQINSDIEAIAKKLHIDIDWARKITPQDIIYLLDRCPFLQILNPLADLTQQNDGVKLIKASSGWTIHDYGNALSSSPGEFLFGGGDFRIRLNNEDNDGEGGSILNPGKGTIHKQAFDTAAEMVAIAQVRGWQVVKLVDGHPKMLRAAWIMAGKLGLTSQGFEPSEHDKVVRDRVNLTVEDVEVLRNQIRPHI